MEEFHYGLEVPPNVNPELGLGKTICCQLGLGFAIFVYACSSVLVRSLLFPIDTNSQPYLLPGGHQHACENCL